MSSPRRHRRHRSIVRWVRKQMEQLLFPGHRRNRRSLGGDGDDSRRVFRRGSAPFPTTNAGHGSLLSPQMAILPEHQPMSGSGTSSPNQLSPNYGLSSEDSDSTGSPRPRVFSFPNRKNQPQTEASASNWKRDRWSPSGRRDSVQSSKTVGGGRSPASQRKRREERRKKSASPTAVGGYRRQKRSATGCTHKTSSEQRRWDDVDDWDDTNDRDVSSFSGISGRWSHLFRMDQSSPAANKGGPAQVGMSLAEQSFLSSPQSNAYVKLRTFTLTGRNNLLVDCGYSYRKEQPNPEFGGEEAMNGENYYEDGAQPQEYLDEAQQEMAMVRISKPGARRATCPEIWLSRAVSFTPMMLSCRLWVLGASQVGKTSLINLLGRELRVDGEESTSATTSLDDNNVPLHLSFLLNNFEVQFSLHEVHSIIECDTSGSTDDCLDLFCVVYSVAERQSFKAATSMLFTLNQGKHPGKQQQRRDLILIANKSDLQRQRKVKETEGRMLAKISRCPFVEMSASLGLNAEQVLEEMMRLLERNLSNTNPSPQQRLCGSMGNCTGGEHNAPQELEDPRGLLKRLRCSTRRLAKSCEGIFQRLTNGH